MMTDPLTLPVRFSPLFYTDAMRTCIDEVCTPLEDAQQGDIVALDIQLACKGTSVNPYAITHVMCLLHPPEQLDVYGPKFERVAIHNLPEEQRIAISAPLMLMQSKGICSPAFEDVAPTMSTGSDKSAILDLLAMPDMSLFSLRRYIHHIFDLCLIKEDTIDQSHINRAFLGILVDEPNDASRTAHEKIEIATRLHRLLLIANTNRPVPDSDQPFNDHPLVLPRIDEIEPLLF
jgi:hypothetical protein